jgi:hypothetical protein
MLLSVHPIPLVFLTVCVGVDSEAILAIFVPFAIINCSAFVVVSASAVFLAIEELPLELFSTDVDVDSVCGELIFLPVAHIHILVGEGVNPLSAPAILILSDVFSAVGVCHLLVLGPETAGVVKKLREELLSGGVEGVGVFVAGGRVGVAGVEVKGGDLHD